MTSTLGVPQNLVSYHLGLLRRGGLVRERRSSRDGRDVYYRLDVHMLRRGLERLRAGLDQDLALSTDPEAARGSVLFLCSGNSARSQIAEALLRYRSDERVDSASAGTRPDGVHPLALEVLNGMGVPTAGLRSKHWSELGDRHFDRIVSLCDIAREELPKALLGSNNTHWSLADPAAVRGSTARRKAVFHSAVEEISERIEGLLGSMAREHVA